MYSKLVVLLGGLTAVALAQGAASSTAAASAPSAPEATAVAGDYSGKWRPRLHFTAPQGFFNDPNGMFLAEDGVYHLYYQYNPLDTVWGNLHWGHATSEDLYTWTNQVTTLAPDNKTALPFSGSGVLDPNNTSGFFPNQDNGVVAVYTIDSEAQESQNIAYSLDGGYSFIPYEGNPVLSIGNKNFRDPKAFWYEDHWVMVLAYAREFVLGIFTSTDLKEWEHASNFSHHGLLGSQYECPNLVEMPMEGSNETMWLMYISINPGAPFGGSIGQYHPGTFNGTHFEAVDAAARISDWGKDNYASQFFYNIPGTENQISIAWASNWQYTNYVPTGPAEGWQSAMSLPRVNYLKNATRLGWTLVSLPYGLDSFRASQSAASNDSLGANGTLNADLSGGIGAFMLDVNITSLNMTDLGSTPSINFTISSSESGESIHGGIQIGTDATQWLDRRNMQGWDSPFFTDRFASSFVIEDTLDFQVIIDHSILEMFTKGGEKSATLLYYPNSLLDTIVVNTTGLNADVQVSVNVVSLEGGWPMGIVQPNATATSQNISVSGGTKRDLLNGKLWSA